MEIAIVEEGTAGEALVPAKEQQQVPVTKIEQTKLPLGESLNILILLVTTFANENYVFRGIVFSILAPLINNDQKHNASIAPTLTIMNLINAGLSFVFIMNLRVAPLATKLEDLTQRSLGDSDEAKTLKKEIAIIFRNGLLISILPALLCMAPMIFAGPMLHNLFQQDQEVSDIAQEFLGPYAALVIAIFYWMCAQQIVSGFRSKITAPIGPTTFAIGLFFSIGLGLGTMGLPQWGVDGLLFGFGIDAYLIAIFFGLTITYAQEFRSVGLMHLWVPVGNTKHKLFEQLKDGLAITTTVAGEMLLFFYYSLLSGWIGTKSQEAFSGIALCINMAATFSILTAICGAMVMSKPLGWDKPELVNPTAKVSLLTSIAIGTVIPLIFGTNPQLLMGILKSSDPQVEHLIQRSMPYAALGMVLDSIASNRLVAERFLGGRWFPTLLRVLSFGSGAIIATSLVKLTDLDIEGIVIGHFLSMLVSVLLLNWSFNKKMQEYREIHHVQAPPSLCQSALLSMYGLMPAPKKPLERKPEEYQFGVVNEEAVTEACIK